MTLATYPLTSSMMTEARYNKATQELEVLFSREGRRYLYKDVPAATVEAFVAAESHGTYFNRHIRPAFLGIRLA